MRTSKKNVDSNVDKNILTQYPEIDKLIISSPDLSNNNNNNNIKTKYFKKSNADNLISINYENHINGDISYFDYSLIQLKAAAKSYSLRISGRKRDIIERLTNYFKQNKNAILIQTIFRGWICRYIIKLRGAGLKNRKICVNDTDFCTMEPLDEIDNDYFYSFTDNNNFTYGFNICSLIESFRRNNKYNPYNRESFPTKTIDSIISLYNLSFILCDGFAIQNLPYKIPINTTINRNRRQSSFINYSPITRPINTAEDLLRYNNINTIRSRPIDNRISELFIEIDALGNYTTRDWFDNLEIRDYIRLYRKLYELWYYRGELSREVQNNICPFYGPFDGIFDRPILHNEITLDQIKIACLIVMENMIYSGINIEYRKLGALHALSALTIVSSGARNSLFWLYESVTM
jgi:hypothetical protein